MRLRPQVGLAEATPQLSSSPAPHAPSPTQLFSSDLSLPPLAGPSALLEPALSRSHVFLVETQLPRLRQGACDVGAADLIRAAVGAKEGDGGRPSLEPTDPSVQEGDNR